MSKQLHHTVREPGWPDPGAQSVTLTAALRLVRTYGDLPPSIQRLQADFGVSRATAYRWRAAFIESLGQEAA